MLVICIQSKIAFGWYWSVIGNSVLFFFFFAVGLCDIFEYLSFLVIWILKNWKRWKGQEKWDFETWARIAPSQKWTTMIYRAFSVSQDLISRGSVHLMRGRSASFRSVSPDVAWITLRARTHPVAGRVSKPLLHRLGTHLSPIRWLLMPGKHSGDLWCISEVNRLGRLLRSIMHRRKFLTMIR